MAVRPVVLYPDPILQEEAAPCGGIDDHIKAVAQDLKDTMSAHKRCVGLAAPQIGVKLRLIAVNVDGHPRAAASHGPLLLVDPQVTDRAGFEVAREGCLSLPKITANVGRAVRIAFRAKTLSGGILDSWTSGFEARALLHEIDHLDGILILDRVASPKEIFARKV